MKVRKGNREVQKIREKFSEIKVEDRNNESLKERKR